MSLSHPNGPFPFNGAVEVTCYGCVARIRSSQLEIHKEPNGRFHFHCPQCGSINLRNDELRRSVRLHARVCAAEPPKDSLAWYHWSPVWHQHQFAAVGVNNGESVRYFTRDGSDDVFVWNEVGGAPAMRPAMGQVRKDILENIATWQVIETLMAGRIPTADEQAGSRLRVEFRSN